ncbi:metallophosphoesterase [uncultured Eubacterium sp.]|uniref:metallophosphoesterase n=1 Tax=uncultured Eubacterium sp. TaxID=165185 RepID=UPI0025FDE44E|nr:metallophosphoesterase [uncultured Eubacterium sp.]
MSLFAIADTHLSFGTDKPMDSFPGWNDYVDRIEKNWNKIVTDDDTVVIAGDISWAMNFDELKADFDFIERLNGKKIILKGNHDYWWNTSKKMNDFIESQRYKTISILFNNSYDVDGVSVCGSRGWLFDVDDEHDEKVLNREVGRLRLSLESAVNDEIIVFLHYPPVTTDTKCDEILNLLKEYGIKKCYYGHLHGIAAKKAVDDVVDGIEFRLISCDRLGFIPKLIR